MSTTFDPGRDDADLAAEYVLGVLDGASRRLVERRAASDRAFAQEIDDWAGRLVPMAFGIGAEEPPAGLWSRIAGQLDRMTRRPPASEAPSRRQVSAVWQWLGLGGMGLAVASLAALFLLAPVDVGRLLGGAPGNQETLTATLAAGDGQPLITVVIDSSDSSATLIPVLSAPRNDEVPELWLLPAGGGAPQSLGVIDDSRPLRLDLDTRDRIAAGEGLAISLEPAGGSPTGQPTGPVVASGELNPV